MGRIPMKERTRKAHRASMEVKPQEVIVPIILEAKGSGQHRRDGEYIASAKNVHKNKYSNARQSLALIKKLKNNFKDYCMFMYILGSSEATPWIPIEYDNIAEKLGFETMGRTRVNECLGRLKMEKLIMKKKQKGTGIYLCKVIYDKQF